MGHSAFDSVHTSIIGAGYFFVRPGSKGIRAYLYLLSVLILSVGGTGFAQAASSNDAILDELETADVVYLAEEHANAQDHLAQLRIASRLRERNPDIVIGLEMVQRPFQDVLDRYITGDVSEAELRQQIEYDARWGYGWKFYAPIFRFAKIYQIPLLALNTPTEITRRVARGGLGSLSDADFRYVPPVADIKTDNQAYRAQLEEVFAQHGGHGNSEAFENFFAAQVLWDETMAEKVAEHHLAQPRSQIIVLAGAGHIDNGYGIPERVARRVAEGSFEQRSVSLGRPEDDASADGSAPTDFVWHFE